MASSTVAELPTLPLCEAARDTRSASERLLSELLSRPPVPVICPAVGAEGNGGVGVTLALGLCWCASWPASVPVVADPVAELWVERA